MGVYVVNMDQVYHDTAQVYPNIFYNIFINEYIRTPTVGFTDFLLRFKGQHPYQENNQRFISSDQAYQAYVHHCRRFYFGFSDIRIVLSAVFASIENCSQLLIAAEFRPLDIFTEKIMYAIARGVSKIVYDTTYDEEKGQESDRILQRGGLSAVWEHFNQDSFWTGPKDYYAEHGTYLALVFGKHKRDKSIYGVNFLSLVTNCFLEALGQLERFHESRHENFDVTTTFLNDAYFKKVGCYSWVVMSQPLLDVYEGYQKIRVNKEILSLRGLVMLRLSEEIKAATFKDWHMSPYLLEKRNDIFVILRLSGIYRRGAVVGLDALLPINYLEGGENPDHFFPREGSLIPNYSEEVLNFDNNEVIAINGMGMHNIHQIANEIYQHFLTEVQESAVAVLPKVVVVDKGVIKLGSPPPEHAPMDVDTDEDVDVVHVFIAVAVLGVIGFSVWRTGVLKRLTV